MKYLKTLFALIGTLVLLGSIWWIIYGDKYLNKARLSEIKTNTATIIASLDAFHAEYGEYSDDLNRIGYSPEGSVRGEFFLSKNKVPSEILRHIRPEDQPFANKDDYQILIVFKNGEKNDYFKVRKDGELETLK